MGETFVSSGKYAGDLKCIRSGGNAAQSVLTFGDHPEQTVNLEDDSVIKQQLKYEFKDTLFSMIIGWAINSAMILMAAATLYQGGNGRQIDDLTVAGKMLSPLMGNAATVVFALALLLAGISSSITAGMAGGTIFSGIFNQPYDTKTKETKAGIY